MLFQLLAKFPLRGARKKRGEVVVTDKLSRGNGTARERMPYRPGFSNYVTKSPEKLFVRTAAYARAIGVAVDW